MSEKDFTYWLQGFMEIENPTQLTERQTQIIKDHLKLVFDKRTPDRYVTVGYESPITYCGTITENTSIC
jgi:hypothetical protein